MPRGAEFADEPPKSDNAIEQAQDAAHGVGKVRLTHTSLSTLPRKLLTLCRPQMKPLSQAPRRQHLCLRVSQK